MASQTLFDRTFPFARVTLSGPSATEDRVGQPTARRPDWKVLVDGQTHEAAEESEYPFLFEDVQYKIRVKSLVPDAVPQVNHRDPLIVQDLDPYADDLTVSGPINFRRQVGSSRLEIRVGARTISLVVEVFPTKLDYATDFERIVEDVSAASRALALEYLRSTYRTGGLVTDRPSGLEWISLLRQEINSLRRSVEYINEFPRKALSQEAQPQRLDRVRASDSRARQSVVKRQGRGGWIQSPFGQVREFVPANRSIETLDTPEHRWIHRQLLVVSNRLLRLQEALAEEAEARKKRNQKSSKRDQAEQREIDEMAAAVRGLRALPVFRTVTAAGLDTPPSLQLVGATGYGDAFRSLMVLRHGLDPTGEGTREHSLSDIHELYEKWCFLEVVRIACTHFGAPERITDLVSVSEAGIRVRLQRGKTARVRFPGKYALKLSYNERFPGLTGTQKPDIVLRFAGSTRVPLIIILDAKYRVDATKETKRAFGLPAPPADAINALHRYRDAIVIEDIRLDRVRPVVRGAALYPLSAVDSRPFTGSNLLKALDTLGVGAIPFLPGNTGHLSDWLSRMLSLDIAELAVPGPPFAGVRFVSRN